ncbi:hypothetical protein PENSPDRAFT_661283 [Peniophora sp. CONT]|nr:hypothetical protein PENSPDRAFT_661283 [Peniophora sp. CONT]
MEAVALNKLGGESPKSVLSSQLATGNKRPAPDDDDYTPSSAKKPKAANGSTSTSTKPVAKRKPKAADIVGICSLNKKDFGDKIKECLRLEKYEIQSMSFNMDVAWFRQFFDSGAGVKIVPPIYDETTPVVVATLSNAVAGSLFGVTKIKNGNRYSTFHLSKMVVILYPAEQRAEAWVSV